MPRLLSVNVGLPRDVDWNGRTVRTAIWKNAVPGRCAVRRLNLDGDGQGDRAGHGGEQRAVFVYQIESYRYWEGRLGRTDFVPGQFGENFTVEGLPDDVVCVGDRYRIGTALFEVTQPRVTCYRVGIRLSEPRMPALLTSSGRPGFYLRVLEEGAVGAGDDILKVGEAPERMTIEELNALLYEPPHPRERLERAVRIEALSPGWRASFEALLKAPPSDAGNAGLAPAAAARPAVPGFRRLAVKDVVTESTDVMSLVLQAADGAPLPAASPGQYVVLRLPGSGGSPLYRSYSLSGEVSTVRYRISVKIEPSGAGAGYLREQVRSGDMIDVSAPRGTFVLRPGDGPVTLLSAGIGATPVLAMLHALAADRSPRPVLWLHTARDGQHHPFALEVRQLVQTLPRGRSYICYSQPALDDRPGPGFDESGHLSRAVFARVGVPSDGDVYLCGPARFMREMKDALAARNVPRDRIFVELFNGSEAITPGISGAPIRSPHPPVGEGLTPEDPFPERRDLDGGARPLVSFARSGVAARWNGSAYHNVLELAEACDVPVRWSCRSGVCHTCETGLVAGAVLYQPAPLDAPAAGNILVCCARPVGDVVIDL